MAVVPLTLAISLGLVAVFVLFFLREHARSRASGAERDSLLPLADETPRVEPPARRGEGHPHDGHHHDDGCGCRDGRRAPCAGCLKRGDSAA